MTCDRQHAWGLFRYERMRASFRDREDAIAVASGLLADGQRYTVHAVHYDREGSWHLCHDVEGARPVLLVLEGGR